MQGFPPAGGVLPKEKKAEIALIVLGIVQKKFRGLGARCMCIYRKCSQYVGRPRSEFLVELFAFPGPGGGRPAGGGRRAAGPDSGRICRRKLGEMFPFTTTQD